MRTQHTGRRESKRNAVKTAIVMMTVLGLSAGMLQAQVVKIQTRPLTPQEIADLGLPAETQTGGGVQNVGIGQPVYLEALVTKGTVATQVVWTIDGVRNPFDDPISSGSTFMPSPIDPSVPPYDGGDIEDYDVADRKILVPDGKATYDISVEATTSNATLTAQSLVAGSVFIGKDHYLCVLCHADKQDAFNLTEHTQAFKNQINGQGSSHFNPNCISCHTVGFDTTAGAVNGGFDDVAADTGWTFPEELSTNNWDDMPVALQEKSNIQCENCHGPADEHMRSLGDTARVGITVSAGNCGQCHDRLSHHVKNTEWATTAHSSGYVFRDSGSCAQCHSSVGFIDTHDPDYAGDDEPSGTGNEGIACATCHDPHEPGRGAHQLRNLESVTLGNGSVVTEGGDGIVCMNCHKSRRDAESYVLAYHSHYGPHHGPQADMLAGENAIEYGMNMPTGRHLQQVDNSCTHCHMADLEGTDFEEALHKAGGHTWGMVWDNDTPEDDTDDVHITASCIECHGAIDSFDFGGEDYDLNGVVEGVQTEIRNLLAELGMLLPPLGSETVDVTPAYLPEELKAAYNYLFVEEDKSFGVHNPKYASSLLRASIDDLSGGIDVDRDGLLDSWEIMQFGDLTSQAGWDDYDSDGLSNEMEFSLGTSPKMEDTDMDGFSDLVEVEGNSDPLDINSIPDENVIAMLPAVELGYLPTNMGSMVQFQAIDALNGTGGWMDLGSAYTNTGDWVFQLESLREGTNKFFRVSEE